MQAASGVLLHSVKSPPRTAGKGLGHCHAVLWSTVESLKEPWSSNAVVWLGCFTQASGKATALLRASDSSGMARDGLQDAWPAPRSPQRGGCWSKGFLSGAAKGRKGAAAAFASCRYPTSADPVLQRGQQAVLVPLSLPSSCSRADGSARRPSRIRFAHILPLELSLSGPG